MKNGNWSKKPFDFVVPFQISVVKVNFKSQTFSFLKVFRIFSEFSKFLVFIMSHPQWINFLLLSEGILRVGNRFVCLECGTESLPENQMIAHMITTHYEPNVRKFYANDKLCIQNLENVVVKASWWQELRINDLLTIGSLMSDPQKEFWNKTFKDNKKEFIARGLLTHNVAVTKKGLEQILLDAQLPEPDNGTVRLIHGKLSKRRKTIVFIHGFRNSPDSEVCKSTRNAFGKKNVNVRQ